MTKPAIEFIQLIVLARICLEFRKIVFQGGTAIRWGYGGTRFSEDLDFYVNATFEKQIKIIKRIKKSILDDLLVLSPDFSLEIKSKQKGDLGIHWLIFSTPTENKKLRLKIEMYQTDQIDQIACQYKVLGTIPAVHAFLMKQGVYLGTLATLIPFESPEGILADKVIAILNRAYIKGRDFWDIWFLTTTLQCGLKPEELHLRMKIYGLKEFKRPFELQSGKGWPQEKDFLAAMRADLERFLSPEEIRFLHQTNFQPLIAATQTVLKKAQKFCTL